MSFFDEGDQTKTRPARPRQGLSAAGGGPPDQQTLLVRRGIAAGIAVLLLILLGLGVKGCLDSRRDRAMRDYNRDVNALVNESDRQAADPFFALLRNARGRSPLDIQTQVNQFRVVAEGHARRARGFDVPDEMKPAQRNLLLALNLRAGALAKIADKIPTALGDEGAEEAVIEIAGQMRAFLASDVIYSQRVYPLIRQELDDADIAGQRTETSQFLDALDWLSPATVGSRLGQRVRGPEGGPVAPGLHGHGLTSVAVGTLTLQPGQVPNRVRASARLAFTVRFENQGDNDEVDVDVRIRIRGGRTRIRPLSKTIDQTRAGSPAEVSIPLDQRPPVGEALTVTVEIVPVPGERMTDNNRQSYTVFFTR